MNIDKLSPGFTAIYAIITVALAIMTAHLTGSLGLIFISALVALGVAAFTWGLVEYVLEGDREEGILHAIFWGVVFFSIVTMFIALGPLASLAIIGVIFLALVGFMFVSGLIDAIDNKIVRVKEARRLKKEEADAQPVVHATYPVNPPAVGATAVENDGK